jgi:hypothetical protein
VALLGMAAVRLGMAVVHQAPEAHLGKVALLLVVLVPAARVMVLLLGMVLLLVMGVAINMLTKAHHALAMRFGLLYQNQKRRYIRASLCWSKFRILTPE